MNRFLKIGIRSSQHASLFRRASRFPANQERLLAAAMFSSFTNGPPHPSQSHPNINNNQQHAQSQAPPSLELPANVERDLREQKQQQQQQQQQQPNSSSSQNTPFQSQLPFTNITFSSATAKVIFDESSHIPTVLVAFATWDEASVKHLQTVMAIANEKYPQRLRVCGLDVDKEAQLIQAMQITSVPATLAIFAGKAVDSFVGVKSPEELAKFLKPLMKNSPTDASKSLQQELTAAFSMFSQADASPDAIESTLKATLDKCSDSDEDERLTAVAGLLRVAILRDDINAASEFHTYLSDALKPATKTKTPKKKQLPNSSAINAQSTVDPRIQGAMSLFEIFELSKSDKDNLKKSAQLFLENEIEPAIDSVLNEIRSKKLPELRELVLKMLNVLKSDGDAASVEKAKKYNARLSNYWFS